MASWDVQLISHIIYGGKPVLDKVVAWGVTIDDFLTAENQAIFRQLLTYHAAIATRGAVLGEKAFKQTFPNYELHIDPSMTTDSLCFELRRQRVVMHAKEIAAVLASTADSDPVGSINIAQTQLSRMQALTSNKKTDIRFSTAMDGILSKYQLAESGQMPCRAKWPWQIMNEEAGGLQEDDYIVFYGRPKSMKTWVLAWMVAYLFDQGHRVLIYTKEMTPENIYTRIAACIGHLPYHELRHGGFDVHDRKKLFEVGQYIMESQDQFICLSGQDVAEGGDTVQWVQAKIEQYKPDVCAIDGLYLLSDNTGPKNQATHERISRISRATRRMILQTRVPVVCTLQANRAAAKHNNANLDEIAFSDSIGQDATIAARVIRNKAEQSLTIAIGGSREFELDGFSIHAKPATDFSFKEVLSTKDLLKAKENDTPEEEPKQHAKPRREPVNGKAKQAAAQEASRVQERLDKM